MTDQIQWTPRPASHPSPTEGWDCESWDVELRLDGRTMVVPFFTGMMHGEPTGAEVVSSLVTDSVYAEMDPWDAATELGYDDDEGHVVGNRLRQFVTETHPQIVALTAEFRRFLGSGHPLLAEEAADEDYTASYVAEEAS